MCRHPSDTILATISAGTGVSMSRLREMTIGSLISQMQAELDVAIGEQEAFVTEWLTARVFISDRSDRKYWETIEFWRQNKEYESGDNTGPYGLSFPPSQIGRPTAF